jgi:hypothetical protein
VAVVANDGTASELFTHGSYLNGMAIDVLDARGRWLMRHPPGMGRAIDVGALAEGGFLLRLHHRAGSSVLRFTVTR